jgi:hypothetical protein
MRVGVRLKPVGELQTSVNPLTDSNFDFYPIREDSITRGVANQGKIGTNEEGKEAKREGKAQTHWFRADVHR